MELNQSSQNYCTNDSDANDSYVKRYFVTEEI